MKQRNKLDKKIIAKAVKETPSLHRNNQLDALPLLSDHEVQLLRPS